MTSARQIYLGSRRGPALPYDAEVEYLESTGTQWIDTGVFLSGSSKIGMSAILPDLYENLALFGASNGAAYNNGEVSLFISGPTLPKKLTAVYPTSNSSSTIVSISNRPKYTPNVLSEMSFDGTGFSIQGIKYPSTWYSAYQAERTCALFAVNRSGGNGQYCSKIKVSMFSIDKGGVLVRDMISVRFTNEQGVSEGAMYDRVSGQLFRNSGTGVFGFGTDIAGGGGINV